MDLGWKECVAVAPHRMLAPAWPVAAALLAALAVVALFTTACGAPFRMHDGPHHNRGADTRNQTPVAAGGAVVIDIVDYAFRPGNVVVTPGTEVTWVNRDGVPHTATAGSGAFDTGLLGQGESATIRLDEPGVYDYACLPHPSMKARVEVKADA
ncbi:MAG: hypothetical protein Kow0010_08290 [Dehalococcoidia bacterium]